MQNRQKVFLRNESIVHMGRRGKMNVSWLLAGAGDIAKKRVAPALAKGNGGSLVSVCDSHEDAAKHIANEYGIQEVYHSYDEALKNSAVDAVYIATPIFLHKDMAIKALESGKHVLVEKPMALSAREAAMMNDAADQAGRMLGVSYFRRYYNKYRHIKEMIDNGTFGKIVLVRLTYFSWYNPDPKDSKYWRVIPEKSGGGPLSDMATHMFDVMIGLLGMPESVYAKTETLVHDYAVEDAASMIMKLAGGARAVGTFHWCSKTWSHEFEIIGTEAKVKWHPYDAPSCVVTIGRDIQEVSLPPADNVHLPLIEDFNQVLLTKRGEEFPCFGREAAKTNILLDAVYQSSREQQEVLLKE